MLWLSINIDFQSSLLESLDLEVPVNLCFHASPHSLSFSDALIGLVSVNLIIVKLDDEKVVSTSDFSYRQI